MITLYHAPRSRSSRIIWLLEELGQPYEIVQVSIKRGDGSGEADPNNPHPHKQVPALVCDGELISESVAIALYLTDRFPEAGLGPLPGQPGRADYLSWLAYYGGVVEPSVTHQFLKLTESQPFLALTHERMTQRILAALRASPYLVGDRFTAVDLMYVSMLQWMRQALPEDDAVDAYVARCSARPALARAQAKDGTP